MHALEAWRIKKNISKKTFIELVGINRTTYERYITYKNLPSLSNFEKIQVITNNEITYKDFQPTVESDKGNNKGLVDILKQNISSLKIPLKVLAAELNLSIATVSKRFSKKNLKKNEIEILIKYISYCKKQKQVKDRKKRKI